MAGGAINFEEAVSANSQLSDKTHDRSTISFPYLDLNTAVEVARAIYNRAGLGACNLDELAAQMEQTMSGAFRLKTGTSKIFGLIDKDGRDSIRLTSLGQRIVNPAEEATARVDAFLSVPLYGAIYEKYRGHHLPPAKALEREILLLGVAPKQTDKARQAFERSAKQAGFFDSGEDRLVRPRLDSGLRGGSSLPEPQEQNDLDCQTGEKGGKKHGGGGDGLNLDPLLIELLRKIPTDGEPWPANQRLRWFRTFAMNVSQIYDDDTSPIDLSINLAGSTD